MIQKKKHHYFGKRLRQIRLEKEIGQEQLAKMLGAASQSYVSEAEAGRFLPSDDKMKIWAEALGLSMEDIEELRLDAEIEQLGISDPGFTMMFKEVPNMTADEKQSIIRAYEAVLKARQARKQKI